LYRALRVDKLTYVAIEATLGSYVRGKHLEEIPMLRMLSVTEEEVLHRSREFVSSLDGLGMTLGLVEGESVVGGGAAPDAKPRTVLISIYRAGKTAEDLAASLRQQPTPVIARISDEKLLIDLRTVFSDQESELANAIRGLAA
jgi:L-seryl-tRNA(Ser) seleniumtransferase